MVGYDIKDREKYLCRERRGRGVGMRGKKEGGTGVRVRGIDRSRKK